MSDITEQIERFRDQLEVLQEAVEHIEAGGLNRKALLVLLSHHTKMSQRDIKEILWGIETLAETYFDPVEEVR